MSYVSITIMAGVYLESHYSWFSNMKRWAAILLLLVGGCIGGWYLRYTGPSNPIEWYKSPPPTPLAQLRCPKCGTLSVQDYGWVPQGNKEDHLYKCENGHYFNSVKPK